VTTPRLSEIWKEGPSDGTVRPALTFETADVGRELGPIAYILDEATVRRYADVMGVEVPLYPTLPARHTGILRDRHYLVDGGGINARTEMELSQPPAVGQMIIITGGVVEKFIRREKPYVVQVAESRTDDGLLLDRVRLTEMRYRSAVSQKWDYLAPK
jgi:hypothetical protein